MKNNISLARKIHFLLIFFILVVAGQSFFLLKMSNQHKNNSEAQRVVNDTSDHLIKATSFFAIERGITRTILSMKVQEFSALYQKVLSLRTEADKNYNLAMNVVKSSNLYLNDPKIHGFLIDLNQKRNSFVELRDQVDSFVKTKLNKVNSNVWFKISTDFIFGQMDFSQNLFTGLRVFSGKMTKSNTIKNHLWQASEYSGRIRAMIGAGIADSKRLPKETIDIITKYKGIVDGNLTSALSYLSKFDQKRPELSKAIENLKGGYIIAFNAKLNQLLKEVGSENKIISPDEWIQFSTVSINKILKLASVVSIDPRQLLNSDVKRTNKELYLTITVIGFVVLFALAAIFYFNKKLLKPLNGLIGMLNFISKELDENSNGVKSSSSHLAKTVSTQSSSIQETAASLEELSAMVKNNVGQAESSKEICDTMGEISNVANENMNKLVESMKEIIESNGEISALVEVIESIGDKTKIIDDIVFQTKILSFNASVEAERAGEYGRGFSVVAQEVSKLAEVSGKAANEISAMVKASVKSAEEIAKSNKEKVENGHHNVTSSAEILKNISINTNKLAQSSSQILLASKDQSIGISQVNEAVAQLDKTTQTHATLSQNAATMGNNLEIKSNELGSVVSGLYRIVMGTNVDKDRRQKIGELNPQEGNVISMYNKPENVELSENIITDDYKKASGDDVSFSENFKKDGGWDQI